MSDLRSISVTPILSRMVEHLIVKDHIFSAITPAKLYNQFWFKPTGSTTAALVDIINTISIMLETNKYVRCLLIDFSKAFDSADHLIVINKLKALNIADNIIHWVVSFLIDRNQFVKAGERWSFTKMINRSIVQGSDLGSTLFTICIIDLQPIGFSNHITKYADDCCLMVPEKCDADMLDEFQHVLNWAVTKCRRIEEWSDRFHQGPRLAHKLFDTRHLRSETVYHWTFAALHPYNH